MTASTCSDTVARIVWNIKNSLLNLPRRSAGGHGCCQIMTSLESFDRSCLEQNELVIIEWPEILKYSMRCRTNLSRWYLGLQASRATCQRREKQSSYAFIERLRPILRRVCDIPTNGWHHRMLQHVPLRHAPKLDSLLSGVREATRPEFWVPRIHTSMMNDGWFSATTLEQSLFGRSAQGEEAYQLLGAVSCANRSGLSLTRERRLSEMATSPNLGSRRRKSGFNERSNRR